MTLAAIPALNASIQDEEKRPAAPPPVDPPAPPSGSRIYPTDTIWLPEYSGSNPSFNPAAAPAVSGGGKFTFEDGTWGVGISDPREPSPGDTASLTFTSAGASVTLTAGRIDQRDQQELETEGRMKNVIILGGNGIKDGPNDPAVFPGTDETNGPHRHSFAGVRSTYWTDDTLSGSVGGLPDPLIDLPTNFIRSIVEKVLSGRQFKSMMLMYWPTFIDGVRDNGLSQSGYIGRPRFVTGIGGPEYTGDVVPPPQGLRMFSFQCGMFYVPARSTWEFSVAFPTCWDGEHEWLPEGAHMAFLQSDGTPPSTHPFVIPLVHWFVSTGAPASFTKTQASNRQSAQQTGAASTIIAGQRRDFWNYNNVYLPMHAEIILAWDPTFAEAICWMVNNYKGLGRCFVS